MKRRPPLPLRIVGALLVPSADPVIAAGLIVDLVVTYSDGTGRADAAAVERAAGVVAIDRIARLSTDIVRVPVLAQQKTWSIATSRTVKLVVVGTAGRPRVDLDAFVTVK